MLSKPLISLISLSSLSTITSHSTSSSSSKPTTSYVSRGVFSFPDFDMNQGGIIGNSPSTLAFGDSAQKLIRISKISEDGIVAVGQTLKSDSASSTDFGRKIDLYQHPKHGNHLFVADANLAYFYEGDDWNTWSLQQVLTPPTGVDTGDSFGANVRVDKVNYNQAAVTCDTCGVSPFDPPIPTGEIYIFESDPRYKSWSQTSVLRALQTMSHATCFSSAGPYSGYSVFLGQSDVKFSDKNILASTLYTNCADGGAILFSKRGGQWSQQQTFFDRNTEYSSFAIESDTIVIGAPGTDYGVTADVGAVYVQYPNTPEYGCKPEPGVPTQWSLHQVLYPPAHAADSLFGSDISINGNRLYVGAEPINSIFYYKRENVNGYWSLQQTLTSSDMTGLASHRLSGSTVLGLGRTLAGAVSTIFEENYDWNCLIVSLEDQFGDGWDTARLQITTPTGETTYVSPHCSASNPFEFRYCPKYGSSEYEGMYRFSVVDGPKSKFFWEIQWRVYEEKTGQWYRGNHATRMDFHFDADDLEFTRRGIVRDLSLNISTCITCPGKPEEKPKPKGRALKDTTHAPTVSPAPTLGQTETLYDAWRYLTLSTTGEPWFDNQHQGTNYYISDTQGHRLLSTGTSCGTLPSLCYQTLPDGQYTLRVSGGLNNYRDDHEWSFCGRVGGAEEQLNFIIKDGECDAVASYTRATYCSAVLQATIIVSVKLEMFGISETTSIELLSDADLLSLSDSIASVIGHGVLSSDVKLNKISNEYGHAIFDVTIGVNAANFGGDPHDLDSMENVVTDVSSIFNNAASSGRLNSALKSTTVQNAQFFQKIEGVHVFDTTLVSINPHADTLVNEMVTNIVQEPTETKVETSPYSQSFYLMVAGYMASIVAVIALAVYAYTQVKSVPTSSSSKVESNKIDISSNKESSTPSTVVNPVVSTSKQQQPLRVVDSTKKSQRMNTIMIADLIQMVKEEDEQLQKTMSSDHFKV